MGATERPEGHECLASCKPPTAATLPNRRQARAVYAKLLRRGRPLAVANASALKNVYERVVRLVTGVFEDAIVRAHEMRLAGPWPRVVCWIVDGEDVVQFVIRHPRDPLGDGG